MAVKLEFQAIYYVETITKIFEWENKSSIIYQSDVQRLEWCIAIPKLIVWRRIGSFIWSEIYVNSSSLIRRYGERVLNSWDAKDIKSSAVYQVCRQELTKISVGALGAYFLISL